MNILKRFRDSQWINIVFCKPIRSNIYTYVHCTIISRGRRQKYIIHLTFTGHETVKSRLWSNSSLNHFVLLFVLWNWGPMYFLMVSDYSVIGREQWRLQFGHHQLKPLSLMLKNGPLLKQRGTNDFRIINCFVYFCHLVKIINRFPSLFCISQNTLINNVLRH